MADKEFTKLIPIANRFIQGRSSDTVSARALHEKLKVGRDFSSWIKARIEQYGFTENEDYVTTVTKTGERKNVRQINYFITLDMAKELAMIERTDEGRKVRRYFIECEKQLQEKRSRISSSEDSKQQPLPALNPQPNLPMQHKLISVNPNTGEVITHEYSGKILVIPHETARNAVNDHIAHGEKLQKHVNGMVTAFQDLMLGADMIPEPLPQ